MIAQYSRGIFALTALLVFSACGTQATNSGSNGTPNMVSTASTGLGTVLAGSSGNTVYVLLSASGSSLPCTGSCTSVWPPVTVSQGASPQMGSGVTATLGTVTRSDGSVQVTANGNPLYYYAPDSGPGQTGGQNLSSFGGTWFVVQASGQLMTSAAAAPVSTAAGTPASGGGYGY